MIEERNNLIKVLKALLKISKQGLCLGEQVAF
jgi:hypothetical protein